MIVERKDRCRMIDGRLWGPSALNHLFALFQEFPMHSVRMEKLSLQDVVRVGPGLYEVTYRFTILPNELSARADGLPQKPLDPPVASS